MIQNRTLHAIQPERYHYYEVQENPIKDTGGKSFLKIGCSSNTGLKKNVRKPITRGFHGNITHLRKQLYTYT